jgi:hypothetical protein
LLLTFGIGTIHDYFIVAMGAASRQGKTNMANLIQTTKTYATAKNAEKALVKALCGNASSPDADQVLGEVRWLIAVAPDGRFAPVLVGAKYVEFIHRGITVVS